MLLAGGDTAMAERNPKWCSSTSWLENMVRMGRGSDHEIPASISNFVDFVDYLAMAMVEPMVTTDHADFQALGVNTSWIAFSALI